MSGRGVNFGDKKSTKVNFIKQNKIDETDVNKILI